MSAELLLVTVECRGCGGPVDFFPNELPLSAADTDYCDECSESLS